MAHTFADIVLWLFVINLGVSFGAGLYESRIVVPRWLAFTPGSGDHWNASAAAEDDVGRRFLAFVTTIPLTLLTIASLVCASTAPSPVRAWWLAAALFALVDRVLTFAYFIPTMLRLLRGEMQPETAAATARRWVRMGFLRHAATLAAWLTALEAFALWSR